MFCERCGGPIDPDTYKCKYCDSWTGQAAAKPQAPPQANVKKNFVLPVTVFSVAAAVIGIALIIVGVLSQRNYAFVWIGGVLMALAVIVPAIAFTVYAITTAIKGISKGLTSGALGSALGSSIKDITTSAGAAIGDFFNRFGPVSFTNKLTREKFDSIQCGTALEHIEAMLGKGRQTYASSGCPEIKVVIWQENSLQFQGANPNRKVVTVKFQDGRAVEKYQFGL